MLSVLRMEEEDEKVRMLAARVMANMDERALEELDIKVLKFLDGRAKYVRRTIFVFVSSKFFGSRFRTVQLNRYYYRGSLRI